MKQFLTLATAVFLATTAQADVWPFETPSGNIECSAGLGPNSSDISCIIEIRQGPPAAPRPAGCNGVWGHSFEMADRGPVTMRCLAANAINPNARKPAHISYAPYGETVDLGGITCLSQRTGFQCTNLDGHGFFLSRRAQRAY